MSDFLVSMKLRNARIRRKVAECGFRNINELSRSAGLHPSSIGALLNLKISPLTRAGTWRRSAVALAEVLGCACEELFSVTQRTLALHANDGECLVSETELLKRQHRVERPLIDNPGDCLLEESDDYTKIAVVRRALDSLRLTQRNRKIIQSYFGIGCEKKTPSDLAQELSVSEQAVRNAVTRALLRLGSGQPNARAYRALLQAYNPAEAMGRAEEARMLMARQRAAVLLAERHERASSRNHAGRRPQTHRQEMNSASSQSSHSSPLREGALLGS